MFSPDFFGDRKVSDLLSQGEIMSLSAAVARQDYRAAAESLDVIARDNPDIADWIARGRAQGQRQQAGHPWLA